MTEIKNDIRRFSNCQLRRACVFVFFGALASFQVNARTSPHPQTTSGNKTTFGNGTFGGGSLGKPTISISPSGVPTSNYPVSFDNGKVTVNVKAPIAPSSAGRAIANAAKKILPGIGTAIAIKELLDELGVKIQPGSNGFNSFSQSVSGDYSVYGHRSTSLKAACDKYAATQNYSSFFYTNIFINHSHYGFGCEVNVTFSNGIRNGYYWSAEYLNLPIIEPTSDQQLADLIAAKSGWPQSSNLPKALEQAIVQGEPLTTEKPTVTGPATSPGEKVTTQNPNGSTQTKTTTNNYKYDGNTVTVTTTTVTNNYNPTTNTTETTTETKEPELKEEKSECEKTPDALGCAELDLPEEKLPTSTKNITYQPESYFGGGACPANKTMNIKGTQVLVFDWATTCTYITNYFRPLLLAICAFVALMILAPGVKE